MANGDDHPSPAVPGANDQPHSKLATTVAENDSEMSLVELQSRIVNVVNQNMEATVAISDGLGFGSGVIVSSDGLILTAGHVVCTGDQTFQLFFPSGRTALARLVGYNLDVDAAMLQIIGGGPWPFVKISDAAVTPGNWAIGLGHSGGYELGRKPPVRTGRVLELRDHMLVTDSVLIGGDSGGPLFNTDGELIGIHSSIGDVISENRHVSIATFRKFWSPMSRGQRMGKLPELGASADDESPEQQGPAKKRERARLGVTMRSGVTGQAVIDQVHAGGAAERVGLKPGDVVLSINGTALQNGDQLIQQIAKLTAGDSAQIEIRRNSTVLKLVVILDKF